MVQTTLKKVAPKKRTKPESDDENESTADPDSLHEASGLSNTPPSAKKQKKAPTTKIASQRPLAEAENINVDGPSEPKPKKKGETATDKYEMLTHIQHIIKRPDTYIGSVERTEQQMWVFNSATEQMEIRKVSYVPGLYKILDEILVNAADNKVRDPSMKSIKVTIDRDSGEFSVENDGKGIPVEMHEVLAPVLSMVGLT